MSTNVAGEAESSKRLSQRELRLEWSQSRLGDPFSEVFLMILASWQGQSLWLQRAKGQGFASCLSFWFQIARLAAVPCQ